MNWKDTLRLMKLRDMQEKTPAAFIASGGFTMKVQGFSDNTANNLTKSIVTWINFSGGHATRINTMGIPRKERIEYYGNQYREKITFTSSTTAKGTFDVSATIQGRSVKVEIKIGRDRLSEVQLKQMQKEEAAGALCFVARDMPSFLKWLYSHFPTLKHNPFVTAHA